MLKDLRNAIAHNNVVFDTRFKTGKIHKRLINLLKSEIGASDIDFNYIDAYIIMIIYFLRMMGESKTICRQFVMSYQQLTDRLKKELPFNIYSKIVSTKHKPNMVVLKKFVNKS